MTEMKDVPDIWSRPRALDHIVHAVHDLDAAAEFYRRAGFQVGARNKHPWGTHNCIVQLDRFYIEILTAAEPALIPPHAARSFSFGAFHRDFLDHGQGLDMLLLDSSDAREDARRFREAGIGDFEVLDFERQGTGLDGKPVKLAFSLTFAQDPRSPEAGFATCQHHDPENFWSPARQMHKNGVRSVGAVILMADNPADHHIFLSAFTGVRVLQSNSIGVTAQTPHGNVTIMDPRSFRDQFGVRHSAKGNSLTFAGLSLIADDLATLESHLQHGNIVFTRHDERLVIRPEAAFGATLIFSMATRD